MLKVLLHRIDHTVEGEKGTPAFFRWADTEAVRETALFRNSRSRYCRMAGSAMVQYGLSAFFGLRPEEIRIRRGAKGKPFLEGRREICFNISHSGEYIVCAFSGREVGIDTERIRRARMNVAHRFFHPAEIAALEGVGEAERDLLFFRFWSIKEAFLKYTGAGLTRPLSSFQIEESGGKISLYEGKQKIEVSVRECGFDPGYTCFVCTQKAETAKIITFP